MPIQIQATPAYADATKELLFVRFANADKAMGQNFTPESSFTLDKATFAIGKLSTSYNEGTVACELYATSGGLPTGPALATSSSVAVADMPLGAPVAVAFEFYNMIDFTFTSPPSLTSGTEYALQLKTVDVHENENIFTVAYTSSWLANQEYFQESSLNGDGKDLYMVIDGTASATIPTEVTGVVTIPNTGGTITLTEDMTVTSSGELTLDVAEVGDLAGGKIITVQPGGKIKLTAGLQVTVLVGTLYQLIT